MVRSIFMFLTILGFIVAAPIIHAEPGKIFTIQVITNKEKGNALKEAKKLEAEKVSDIRVEKIGDQYVVRIGKFTKQTDGAAVLQKIRQAYPESMLRTAYDMPERELYEANTTERKPVEPKPAEPKPAAKTSPAKITAAEKPAAEKTMAEKPAGKSAVAIPAAGKGKVASLPAQGSVEKSKISDRHYIDDASEKAKATTPTPSLPVQPATAVAKPPAEQPPVTPPATVQVRQEAVQLPIVEKAMQLFQNQQYEQAAEMFYAITRQKNVDIATYEKAVRRLADCYYLMGEQGFAGKHIIAVEHYKAILRNYPDPNGENDLAYYRLAISYERLKFYYEAAAGYDGLIKKYPDSQFIQEAMYGTGVMTKKIGRYAQAADRLRLYLNKYPSGKYNREARFSLAECYYEMKDMKNALQSYEEIIKRWPNKADMPKDAVFYMGCWQYEAGRYQEAIESLSYFLSVYPQGEQTKSALYALAASFYGSRQYRTAVQLFSQVIEAYPGSQEATESLIALGNLGILQGENKIPLPMEGRKYVEDPIAAYDIILAALPESELMQRVLYLKARGLEKTGRFFEAFEVSSASITRYPKGSYASDTANILKSAFKSLVNDLYNREDYLSLADLYFKTFHKGFYEQPDDDVLMKIAKALQKLSFKKEALTMLNYLDAVCKDGAVKENIRKDMEILKQGESTGSENLLNAGDRLYVEGKYQEALQWYEGALKNPDNTDKRWILHRLALCKMKTSDGETARKNIASLKGGGEDAFWAKVADYMSEEDKRKERYSRLAPN